MPYTALIISFVALAIALMVALCPRIKWWMFALAIAVFIGSAYLSDLSVAVMAQVAALMLGGLFRYGRNWRYRTFAMVAVGSSLAIYALAFYEVWVEVNSYRTLRDGIPSEPLARRLPPVARLSGAKLLTEDSKQRLMQFDARFPIIHRGGRQRALAVLHQRTLETFIKSPGNGFERNPPRASAESIELPDMADPIRQPAPFSDAESEPDPEAAPTKTPATELASLHQDSVVDFVNRIGFGILTNDKQPQLFGFQPHHFRKLPRTDGWKVRSIELVGILLHEDPRVYATTELPRMDKIRTVPTRSLDRFEAAGMLELQAGGDFFTHETQTGVRMLGAIRSIGECVRCHGGERGDLLGAFSYVLKSDAPGR